MYTENHDENLFLKADRAISKLNSLHLKPKTNLVILRKCNSHLQNSKINSVLCSSHTFKFIYYNLILELKPIL